MLGMIQKIYSRSELRSRRWMDRRLWLVPMPARTLRKECGWRLDQQHNLLRWKEFDLYVRSDCHHPRYFHICTRSGAAWLSPCWSPTRSSGERQKKVPRDKNVSTFLLSGRGLEVCLHASPRLGSGDLVWTQPGARVQRGFCDIETSVVGQPAQWYWISAQRCSSQFWNRFWQHVQHG